MRVLLAHTDQFGVHLQFIMESNASWSRRPSRSPAAKIGQINNIARITYLTGKPENQLNSLHTWLLISAQNMPYIGIFEITNICLFATLHSVIANFNALSLPHLTSRPGQCPCTLIVIKQQNVKDCINIIYYS